MKRLCICCDGTWNSADQQRNGQATPTNVVRIAYRIAKQADSVGQVTYYDQGVGTGNAFDRATGGAFGTGLEGNIHDAYRFLVANYELGDELYLFGFSRGAFTVRSLAGLIRKSGILKRSSVEQYRAALDLYRSEVHPDDKPAVDFRNQHSIAGTGDIEIKFVGVWDTVGALGIPLRGLRFLTMSKHQFHDTELSRTVKNGYHALAIDEHRAPFEPTLWAYKPKGGQVVEQVWFCGAHSDVGGGRADRRLADLSLAWMIEKARACGLGFDTDVLGALALNPDPLARITDSMTGLYNVTPRHERVIGVATSPAVLDKTQHIHPSVTKRWDDDPSYRPKNLQAYFKLTGDTRAST